MKCFALVLAFTLSFISLVHSQQATDDQLHLRNRLYQRFDWACLLTGQSDRKDAFSARLNALWESRPAELTALAEFWETRATRELTATLEFLGLAAKRDGTNLASAIESQYRLFYFEKLDEIEAMLDELSKRPKEAK
jgi:hypothetical protein